MKLAALLALVALPLSARPLVGDFDPFAGYATPAAILRGIAYTESGCSSLAVGDDGVSIGMMQINELYHADRTWRFGEYDPRLSGDSIRIADALFRANSRALLAAEPCVDPDTWERKREDLAIAAHRQGLRGVLTEGPTMWYVERVRRLGK